MFQRCGLGHYQGLLANARWRKEDYRGSPGHSSIRVCQTFPQQKGGSGPFSIYSLLGCLQAEGPHFFPETVPPAFSNTPTGFSSPDPRREDRTTDLKPAGVREGPLHGPQCPVSWARDQGPQEAEMAPWRGCPTALPPQLTPSTAHFPGLCWETPPMVQSRNSAWWRSPSCLEGPAAISKMAPGSSPHCQGHPAM